MTFGAITKHCCLAAVLLLLVLTAYARAAENTAQNSISLAWSIRTADLQRVLDEAATLQQNAQQMARDMADELRQTQAEISSFLNLYQASRNRPIEQLIMLQQMQGLRLQLRLNMQPLQAIAERVKGRLQEIAQLKQDMQNFDSLQISGSVNEEEAKQQADYKASLQQAQKRLTAIANRIDTFLSPINTTYQRLGNAISEIEKNLLEVWRDYYFIPAGSGADGFSAQVFASWVKSLSTRFLLAYPRNQDDWLYVGARFALNILVMGLVGFFIYRAGRRLPKRWRTSINQVLTHSWIWLSLGLALLLAAHNRLGGTYFIFIISGVLILIWGLAALSWRLRTAARPNLQDKLSPMRRLFVPAAIGVLLLYSDLPPKVLLAVWALIMGVFILWLRFKWAELACKNCGLLERITHSGAFYVAAVSLIMALLGYARLAILFYMLLFALVNILVLGSALSALGVVIVDKLLSKEKKPVFNALLRALTIPGAWLLSLLCTLPWIWAVPGAGYLLKIFLSSDYTIGEASFDFSKVIIIAVLFFLFRSFVSLSKTSLTHLPERIPHLESGVIPPLRSLAGYLLWIIFALTVLGILGVNFTSLAVVAGGLSVGVGLGLQSLFNNMVSGLILIFGKTVLVGDYVEVGGVSGTVKAVSIRSILIETPDRSEVFIPNSTIMAGQFINWTRNHRMVRRTINIGVAYGTDVPLVMSLLKQMGMEQEHVLKNPEPFVLFSDFADSTLNFNLYVYIDDFDHAGATTTALRVAIEKAFREHNIDIAFPQLDVHVYKGED